MTLRLLLPAAALFFLTACGQPGPSATTTSTAPASAPAAIYEDLSPEEFADRIGADNTVILDVRTPGETAGGVIDGAIELDYRSPDFSAEVAALDKNKTYLVYCASGGRSGKACRLMKDAGFKEVYNLKGGYGAWKE